MSNSFVPPPIPPKNDKFVPPTLPKKNTVPDFAEVRQIQKTDKGRKFKKKWVVLTIVLLAMLVTITFFVLKKNVHVVVGTWTNGNATYTFEKDGNGALTNDFGGYAGFEWEAYDADEGALTILSSGTVDYWYVSGDMLYVSIGGIYAPLTFERVKSSTGYSLGDKSKETTTTDIYSDQGNTSSGWENSTGTEWWLNIPETWGDNYKFARTTGYYKNDIISWAYQLTGMKFWIHLDSYREGRTADDPPYIIIEAFLKAEGVEPPFEDDIYELTAIVNPRDSEDLYLYIRDNTYGIDICEYNNSSVSEYEGDDVMEEPTNISTLEPIMPTNPIDTVPPSSNSNVGTVDTTPPSQSATEKPAGTMPPEPEKVVKSFVAETLTKASISDTTMFVTMDNDNNLIYYDDSKNAIFSLDPDSGEVETLLDMATATYTGSDGVIYEGMTVNQVFWDNVSIRLLVDGTFWRTKAEDSWETGNGNQPYSAIFTLKDGILEKAFEKPEHIGRYKYGRLFLTLENGTYVCGSVPSADGMAGYRDCSIIDFKGKEDSIGTMDGRISAEYAVNNGVLYKIEGVNRGELYWIDRGSGFGTKVVENEYYGNGKAMDYQNDYFYIWEWDKIQIVRPSDGARQTKLNPAEDVEIMDAQVLSLNQDNLFVTTDEQYLFYDNNVKAIRVIRANPEAN